MAGAHGSMGDQAALLLAEHPKAVVRCAYWPSIIKYFLYRSVLSVNSLRIKKG